ncbi:bile acid:sodium symporter family protein [Sporosarcina sp. PTS2304]|uniref:bile acid:sodium symporter family protein n=1 Tax=Sporosarcina sp. PTS2304 TaxID=2283194 RepID=UPI000E0DB33E|nr:bile acid:sodium symporter family protein [Sporosarcina sp. PTS2304]AXI00015.1 bile acid:sodium symporter family protein [Sporosarcina sp. PTS2304]
MLAKVNTWLQRRIAILTPLSLVLGVMFHQVGEQLLFIVSWLFAFMTFVGSLGMNAKETKMVVKYPSFILASIAFLHILMPIWAYFLSTLFFDDHLLTVGFVLAVAIPTGVTSIIWVSITRGNLPLCLSIILLDTLLAPIILPAIIHVVAGERIAVDTTSLIVNLLWMIVLPTILGIVLNELTKGKVQTTWVPKLAPFSKLSLFAIVGINGSAAAPYVKVISWELVGVIALILFIAVSGYAGALTMGHLLWKDPDIATTFMYVAGMRNIATGVVVATTFFPAKVVLPVVFGMLFQQILASFYSKVAARYRAYQVRAA